MRSMIEKVILYTFDLIHRHMFVVRGKKRRKGGGRSEKDMLVFLLPDRRAHPTSSLLRISSFQPRYPVKISSVIYIVPGLLDTSIYP
jgi:hypothetical protein